MKKSLLAVAAIGAFASAAQAQSSVTVYGILDVGYIGGNGKASVGSTTNGTSTKTDENINQFGQSAESSSRLGFKGTEDLGGGTSAFFTAEVDVTPTGANGIGGGGTNNRQTFVGLKKNGIGQGAVGTQYTLVHDAVGATTPTGNTNVIGDVIYPRNSGTTTIGSSANGTSIGYTVRTNNALKFNSDKFAGFGVNAFYNLNNRNQNETINAAGTSITGGTTNTNGWGVSADYTFKKFYINAAYQSFKQETDATSVAPVPAAVLTSGNITNATDNQFYAGASYDFGILKAYAQYLNRKATSTYNSNVNASRTAQQIGVRSFITPTIEAWVSGGMGRYTASGTGEPTANFTGYQLGSNYWLSKRTNLYAIFGSSGTSSTTSSTGSQNVANGNNYAVGVRHTF